MAKLLIKSWRKVFLPPQQCISLHFCNCHAKIVELSYELLPQLPYSSANLAPCNFFLFANTKKFFGGKRRLSLKQTLLKSRNHTFL